MDKLLPICTIKFALAFKVTHHSYIQYTTVKANTIKLLMLKNAPKVSLLVTSCHINLQRSIGITEQLGVWVSDLPKPAKNKKEANRG